MVKIMKNILLAVGIICIVACVLFLLLAILNMHGYYNLYDGSRELYARLHHKMTVFFSASGVCGLVGAVCIIFRFKM